MALSQHAIAAVGLFDSGFDYEPERMLAEVSPEERQRYEALRRPQGAHQYLASRWLLRQHLAGQLEMAPLDVPLQFSGQGPPTVGGIEIHLGLSHSHGSCLCISSRQVRVGCDVEHQRTRRHDVRQIAAQCFDPDVARRLGRMDAPQRLADFHRLWTLKEASLKALGRGIENGLHRPAFVLRPAFACTQSLDAGAWTFAACDSNREAGQYSLALAIRACSGSFDVYRYRCSEPSAPRQLLDMRWTIASTASVAPMQ